MKRYEDWGDLGMHEADDGDWVRFEDADRELRVAKAAARDYHEALEELRARVTRAQAVLATPGTWSPTEALSAQGLYVVTAEAKAVLDAMAEEYIVPGVHPRFAYSGEGACRAELARRGAAK